MNNRFFGWPYSTVYSSRKTIAIKLNPDRSITVKAPYGTSAKTVHDVLRRHMSLIMTNMGRLYDSGVGGEEAKKKNDFLKGTLALGGREVPYEVTYSDRNSLSVKINHDATVLVRAPAGTSQKTIEEFVERKSDWIFEHFSQIEGELEKLSDIVEYKKILVFGEKFDLVKSYGSKIADGVVYYNAPSAIMPLFVKNYGGDLVKLTRRIAGQMGVKPSRVEIKSYKSRWGCCDSSGVITLNYKLLMIPRSQQEYVIVHELCHLFEMNHSKRFWTLVGSVMPDYKEREKMAHEYDFLLRLYP
ncbi:MAG: M48 family metallopeptidase [Clostridia bacterium]|nr:M48 family metallopeptidase [Clostridia bacterium]